MLRRLHIRNFAILEDLELSFTSGLTVFTGETGAGKTILVEAIRFLLGGRTGVEMIRTGADRAVVEGDFDGTIIRRELSATGRSRCFRDEEQLTLAELATLGEALADHCGQHSHQVLLDPSRHLEWLDRAASALATVERVKSTWSELWAVSQSIRDLEARIARRREEEELRAFQIGEIRAAALQPDEEEQRKAEATVLKHARRLAETAELALQLLTDEESSVEGAIGRARREAENAAHIDPRWQEIVAPLTAAGDAVVDAVRALTHYRDSLAFDPMRADQIEARLSEIYRLKKKYGESVAAILAHLAELESEQSSSAALDDQLRAAAARRRQLEDTLVALCADLSIKRHTAAESLAAGANAVIQRLSMAKAAVRIDLTPHTEGGVLIDGHRLHDTGAESVQFLFEANPAEGFKPLHKIASGGELSRLLLAFKSAVQDNGTQHAATKPRRGSPSAPTTAPLYIFDEIDSGIGGQTAHAVAREIKTLAADAQVFLITHLQQLATVADTHFRITKQTAAGRARVIVEPLSGDARIQELARMIAGDEVTDRTLELAAELANAKARRKR